MGGGERRVKHVGGPDGSWGASPREATSKGGPRTVRASAPLIGLGDGSAAHTGKGRTGLRSLHRKHGPTRQDRTPRPTARPGIAKKAAGQKGERCRNLYGRRNEDFLKQCGRDLRQDAASGVAQVRAQA